MENVSLKKIFVTTLGVVVIVAAIIISLNYFSNSEVAPTPEEVTKNKNELLLEKVSQLKSLTTSEQQDVIQAIAQAGNLRQCEYAEGIVIDGSDYYSVCRNNFLLKHAILDKDLAMCDALEGDPSDIRVCKTETAYNLILSNKTNLNICNQLDNERDILACETNYQLIKGVQEVDASFCANIENDASRKNCSFQVSLASFLSSNKDLDCSLSPAGLELRCENFKKLLNKNQSGESRSCNSGLKEVLVYDFCKEVESIYFHNKL